MANVKSVFVSYSSEDRKLVNTIVQMLKEEKLTYWKAPEMIPAGSSYAREIPRAIKECEVFLIVLSRTSQKSIWVEKEIDSAISHRKTIIPFQIDDVPLNDTFRFYLNNVQMISYDMDKQAAFVELKRQLKHLLNKDNVSATNYRAVGDNVVEEEVSIGGNMKVSTGDRAVSARRSSVQFERNVVSFPKKRSSGRADSNALRMNRIPLACDYCGSKLLENITMGTYRCQECGQDSYDDYQTIRNYLDKVGNATAVVIEQNTGVPKRIIEYFFRDEYLEIPKSSSVRVPCENCGAPIRTGTLCENCKSSMGSDKKMSNERRGSWHTLY